MEFIDLKKQQQRIKDTLSINIEKVLQHGHYVMGPEIKQLESKLADYVGVKHAIACASGTDALLMALMAYDIKPGDAVFTTPFTFIATAEVIGLLGATPVFVDIDPKTFNIDPAKLSLAIEALKNNDPSTYPLPDQVSSSHAGTGKGQGNKLSPKGVIAVDLFGLPADYDAITAVAKKHGLFVIEDAAQSFGGKYKDRKACSFGNIACTSFFPAKPLGCYGDGGMCFTRDDQLAAAMESIRVHGKGEHKYDNVRIGINGRLDTLQAAVLLAKFDIFPDEIESRQAVARRYTDLIADRLSLTVPHLPKEARSAWAQYSILAKDEDHRTDLLAKLQDNKIPTAIYYPTPLHCQTAFAFLGYPQGALPISEDVAKRIFSIPMHPYLDVEDQKKIVKVMEDGY